MIRLLIYLVVSASLASSPGHTIKYRSLKGKYVEEEVSSATYDILPEGYDEAAQSDPWDIKSISWAEWPVSSKTPELRINGHPVEASSSEENDILLAGSRINCILGSKAIISGISIALLFATLYWREMLCQDEKQIGILVAWISLMVLAMIEEGLSIVDVSFIGARYFNLNGAIAVILRILSGLALLMPFAKLIGLLFFIDKDGGPVRDLCNTTLASPFVQWKWIGLEMVPAGLLFLVTLGTIKANNEVMDRNTGSIVIYDRPP